MTDISKIKFTGQYLVILTPNSALQVVWLLRYADILKRVDPKKFQEDSKQPDRPPKSASSTSKRPRAPQGQGPGGDRNSPPLSVLYASAQGDCEARQEPAEVPSPATAWSAVLRRRLHQTSRHLRPFSAREMRCPGPEGQGQDPSTGSTTTTTTPVS